VTDGVPQCRDSVDNDGDGKIDYPEDIGCLSPDDDSEVNGGGVGQCEDGLDNDQDGTSDENDSGCFSNGTYNPNENETSPQCSDGIDNDGNGTVDFPDDIGCSSADDNDEYSKASLSLKSSPALIKKGEVCTLKASAENVTSCTVTGDGVSQALKVGKNGVVNETTILSPKLAGTTTYTLSCKTSSGTVSEKTQCKVTPSFEEF
jgi:hypothetical protein